MKWQEYRERIHRPENPSRQEWDAAVQEARDLLKQVDEKDRDRAESILSDVFFEWPEFDSEEPA